MGLLRRSRSEDAEDDGDDREPGVYRLEVDNESHHFSGDVTYSFWSSTKIIFLLAILLWWLPQSAGYMVAGYVGGRRAGSPWKAVFASLIPVVIIFAVSAMSDAGYGRAQIGYVATLPASLAVSLGDAIPFIAPYSQFVAEYLTTFVLALQQLFGMGSNGYLVTIAFAYIGGIVADQTRRELEAKRAASTAVNIFHPFARTHHRREEGEPVSHAKNDRQRVVHVARVRHGNRPAAFATLRKLPALVEAPPHAARRRIAVREEEPRPTPPKSTVVPMSVHRHRDDALATQKFVERALRAYERPRHDHRNRT